VERFPETVDIRLGATVIRQNVYRRYAIVVERDLREGVAKLAALEATVGPSRTVVAIGGVVAPSSRS